MERKLIEPKKLNLDIVQAFLDDWMLLTAGSFKSDDFNTMTIA